MIGAALGFDALTRPYRGPLPVEKALDIVSSDVPGRLDRRVFAALESQLGRSTDPLAPGVLTVAERARWPAPPATAPRAARPSGG